MCLLIVRRDPCRALPLIVAANRDEWYHRPALGPRLLRATPRIVGGLDQRSGGTWLAVGGRDMVVGLTNWPQPGGPDPARASRGGLVLALAAEPDATAAARRLQALDGRRYNPCFLVLADRQALWTAQLDASGAVTVRPHEERDWLVLENAPLDGPPSPKQHRVRDRLALLEPSTAWRDPTWLAAVLADHAQPVTAACGGRPPPLLAACVHTEPFGTRSAAILAWDQAGQARYLACEGPPCRAPWHDVSTLLA